MEQKGKLRFPYSFIWQLSELLNIPLGRFAPFVLGKILGVKGVKINKHNKTTISKAREWKIK